VFSGFSKLKYCGLSISVLVTTFLLLVSHGIAQNQNPGISVVEEQVYANLSVAPIADQLSQLAETAGIELSLSGSIEGTGELEANGKSLRLVVDQMLPDDCGYVFELDADQKVRRLLVFANDSSTNAGGVENERQRYLARQVGKRDDGTAAIMLETLADRNLDDKQAKLIAIEQLVDIESEQARESLLAGMGDHDPQVRLSTAKALYHLQGDAAITLIGQIYFAEDSTLNRKAVAAVVSGSSHPLAQGIVKDSAGAK